MEGRIPPLSADQLREQLRAERVLADMELMEDLAQLHETELNPAFRQEFADRYRRVLGVAPRHRMRFREELEKILHDSGGSVAEAIEGLGGPR